MKFLFAFTCFIAGFFYLALPTSGQRYENPDQVFEPIKFEYTHRGTFNMSMCSRDLINCWEFMRPDVQCSQGYVMESVCTLMRKYCDDVFGYRAGYGNQLELMDNYCEAKYVDRGYTRRSAKWDTKEKKEDKQNKKKPYKEPDVKLPHADYGDFRRRYFANDLK